MHLYLTVRDALFFSLQIFFQILLQILLLFVVNSYYFMRKSINYVTLLIVDTPQDLLYNLGYEND